MRAVLSFVLLLYACAPPRYEMRRVPAQGTTWQRCAVGVDHEERLASWCPSRVLLGTAAAVSPEQGGVIVASLDVRAVPAGPVVLDEETVTYLRTGLKDEDVGRFIATVLRAPTASLLEIGRALPALRMSGGRRASRLSTTPTEVEVQLPRGKRGRLGAWAVWGWPGGRAREVVDLAPLVVPTGSRLAVPFALAERSAGSPPVTFRVETGAGDRLWEERVESGRQDQGWHDAEIDLAAHAGSSLALRLIAVVDGGPEAFSYPVWGEPALLVPLARGEPPRLNVLLVSLDTLRGDFPSFAGHPVPTTPALDAFATEGVAFLRAFSTFPSTAGAHMSMLTSLPPCAHRITLGYQTTALSLAATTLAEAFAAAGWRTAAITEDGMIRGALGFARGFDRYVDQPWLPKKRLGRFPGGIERTLDWLAADASRPFFYFLHTYQPHAPYKVPPHLRDRFQVPPDANEMDRLRIDYEAGIRYTDELFDGLLQALRARGLLDTTLVAITSDHGEAFGERGMHGHGQGVFDEQLHVPLVLRHPRLTPAGRRVDTPVSLLDLAPTLLDAAGIEAPPSFAGRSLLPLVRGEANAPAPSAVFGEQLWGTRQTIFRTPEFAWIDDGEQVAVYDLASDPGQRHDLAPTRPIFRKTGARMIKAFRTQCDATGNELQAAGPPQAAPIEPAREEALRALGYVE